MVLAIQLTGSNTEKYFTTVLNVVLLFTTLSYIVIFPALIKFASIVGQFPGFLDHKLLNNSALPDGFTRSGFELTVFVPVVITLGVGLLFYVLGAPTRAQSVDIPPEAEAEAAGA